MRRWFVGAVVLSTALAASPAFAVIDCELDGKSINVNNGAETAGKSGLLRCRDRDTGLLQREEDLRDGRTIGAQRFYQRGVLLKERTVNERGNGDGLQREYAGTPGDKNPLLREETQRNGTTVGLARAWYPAGGLRRVAFHDDKGQELAVAEFNPQGQLADLRCDTQPRLAPAADDAAWCGHRGASTVSVYASDGRLRGKASYDRGERTAREALWDNGKTQEREQVSADGGTLHAFDREGVKRREQQWVWADEGRRRRITVLEREFHESGALQRERRWTRLPAGVQLAAETQWYLNGQPRVRTVYEPADKDTLVRREQSFGDDGKVRFEGQWLVAGRYEERPQGTHKQFDERGRLRQELVYDARGRLARERVFDEAGKLLRDDELFEDGSRKSAGR